MIARSPHLRPALRCTLFSLHAAAVFAAAECVLIWAVFRFPPAAVVGGFACAAGGVLALLSYPRTPSSSLRVILARGLRLYLYATALIIGGALVLRAGQWTPRVIGPTRSCGHVGHVSPS